MSDNGQKNANDLIKALNDLIKALLEHDVEQLKAKKDQINDEKLKNEIGKYIKKLNDWKSLSVLFKDMRRVKWCFHFTRNNPNHTKRFYHELINIVGYDNWQGIRHDIRQSWEEAANRFDMQYGLVKSWYYVLKKYHYNALRIQTPPEKAMDAVDGLNKKMDDIKNVLGNIEDMKSQVVNLSKTIEELKGQTDSLKEATQDAKKSFDCLKDVQNIALVFQKTVKGDEK